MTRGRWDERIARAQQLSATYPFAEEILRFYERIAAAQAQVYARVRAECGDDKVSRPAGGLREELDLTVLLPELRGFLGIVERHAPAPLSAAARELAGDGSEAWVALLTGWWSDPGSEAAASLPDQARFCARAFLEPYAQFLAEHTEPPAIEETPSVCPLCSARPQLGVLRPEGDGARRSLVCSLCATEWNYGRILCPACGEGSETRLAIYIAEEIAHMRVEACEACHSYIKTVDLSKNGHAVPVVDEIAAMPLDLWARENGYTKLQTNLLGM
jgi:FdhE protein